MIFRRFFALFFLMLAAPTQAEASSLVAPDGRITIFETAVAAPATASTQGLANVVAHPPNDLHWVALDPRADQVKASVAFVQTREGMVLFGRTPNRRGTWTLHWSTQSAFRLPPVKWLRARWPLLTDADCLRLTLSPADQAACPVWRQAQLDLRAQIRTALMPGYRIDSGHGAALPMPTWAPVGPAFNGTPDAFETMEPIPPVSIRTWRHQGERYFALPVPWDAWPLTSLRQLTSLYVQASYCPKKLPCVVTGHGDTSALEFKLVSPLVLNVHPCVTDYRDETYLRLSDGLAGPNVTTTFLYSFENPGGGYLDRPDPSRISPELWRITYETVPVPSGSKTWRVCLPRWRLWDGREVNLEARQLREDQIVRVEQETVRAHWMGGAHPFWEQDIPQYTSAHTDAGFKVQRQLDAHRTLLINPYQNTGAVTGEGAYGACDRATFSVWIVDVSRPSLTLAFHTDDFAPDGCGYSGLIAAELSADGLTIALTRTETDYDPPAIASTKHELPESPPSYGQHVAIVERFCLDDTTNTYLLCQHDAELVEAQP